MDITPMHVIISIVVYTISIAGSCFAFGSIWAKKQDKSYCFSNHAEIIKEETESRRQFWDAITGLRREVASVARDVSVLAAKYESLEKMMRVEDQLRSINKRLG